MAAYIICDIEITDPVRYANYRQLVPPTLAKYDGRFVVRGGACETLEGAWRPQRVIVLEFPSAARAKEWLDSPEYCAARALRHSTAKTEMILVEGVA